MARTGKTLIASRTARLERDSSPFSVYKGKRVFVTGHTGFKGSWLCAWLNSLGAEVTGYALPPDTRPNLFDALNLEKNIRHIVGDVRDLVTLYRELKDSKAEIVFHMAAQPLVRLSYKDPKTTFDTNVGGTVNIFEALRNYGKVRAFVNVTSDKCYDNKEWLWGYRESDPMGGRDPYSASKGCAELVFAAYQQSFFPVDKVKEHGLGLASARAGNVIGGGDWAEDRIVPDCIRALSDGKRPGVRNPNAIRPWQHVLEPLSGYLKLGAALWNNPAEFTGAWNFGPRPENCRSVRDIADAVVKSWGEGSWQDLSSKQSDAVHEAKFLRLCCDKAMTLLKWNAVWDFETTVRNTTEWYKDFHADDSAAARLCKAQLQSYTATMFDSKSQEQRAKSP